MSDEDRDIDIESDVSKNLFLLWFSRGITGCL